MKPNRLRFERNKDPRVDYYNVFRSEGNAVTKRSVRVMRVGQIREVNPLYEREDFIGFLYTEFRLKHRTVLEDPKPKVWGDGVLLDEGRYKIVDGTVYTEDVIEDLTIEYYFDGIEVIDDVGENGDLDINYYGPPGRDTERAESPYYVSLEKDSQGNVEIHFSETRRYGVSYRYAIEAKNDRGDSSVLSESIGVNTVTEVKEYIIETSTDGVSWEERGRTTEGIYKDLRADEEPPEGLSTVGWTKRDVTDGVEVTITWKTPLLNQKRGYTPRYRVRTLLEDGRKSEPSLEVGPEEVLSNIQKIVVLRKIGTVHPTFGDATAEQVAEITTYNSGSYVHKTMTGKVYAYSLFVVDAAGNHSIATTLNITT